MLNSPSNLSFKFGAKFSEMDKKFTLAWNAIDELTSRVNNISTLNMDAELDALNSKIMTNTEDITDLESTKADISYIDNLMAEITSRVNINESDISSLDESLKALTSNVTTNTTNITTLDTNLKALTTNVTTNTKNIEKDGGWIDNLVSSVAYKKDVPFDDFYKHLFDMIYPIGSIYTTVTNTDPPNIYDMSGNPYATWVPLPAGKFLRNLQENKTLGSEGGTPTTQLPAHTHTTNVTIDGKLYSATLYSNYTGERNCNLLAPKGNEKENVFSNASAIYSNDTAINGSIGDDGSSSVISDTRTTLSTSFTNTYFPITLSVNENYDTISTTAANTKVKVIASNELPDNCPPFMYVKMWQRTA